MVTLPKKFDKEKDVKAEVKKILNAHGWFWFMPPNNGYGKSGASDFFAWKVGIFMAIETKRQKEKSTELQRGFLNSLRAHNHDFCFVVNEDRLDTLSRFLTMFDDATKLAGQGKRPTDAMGAGMLDAIREMQVEL